MTRGEFLAELGIHPGFKITEACADFYILERLAANGQIVSRRRLDIFERQLAHEFSSYLDMAVGGEARHLNDSEVRFSGVIIAPTLERYLTKATEVRNDRTSCWKIWTALRRAHPESVSWLLDVAESFNDRHWPRGSIGGPAWATVAKVLYDFYDGGLKRRTFVDRCFTLEHNYGCVFDKVYDVTDLKRVLIVQAEDNYNALATYASRDVAVLWNRNRWEVRQDFDPVWLGRIEYPYEEVYS
jgi:hypothetical protein